MISREEIGPIIEQKLAQMGLELYDIRFSPAGPKSLLRIYIDKDNGVTIDDCEAASIEISHVLDVENFSQSPYRLEVSSPGADRALKTEKDFNRAKGRTVRLDVRTQEGKTKALSGAIIESRDASLFLESKTGTIEIALDDIVHAKIEFSFK